MLKKIILILTLFALNACQDKDALRVGTISGPETQLMDVAQQVAKDKYGLKIVIIEFTDYLEPNSALNDGSLEANMFQHQPYLDRQIHDRGYKLATVGKTFVFPMGIYSQKIKTLAEIPDKAKVAIPNDPSNEGRALLLLEKAGLIKLNPKAGAFAMPGDIKDNPKHIKFEELDAAQLARSLPDVSIAVINTNFAIPAGLSPTKDAILHEEADSPYANIIVVRQDQLNDPRISQLVAAIQSPEVAARAKELFNDQAIPAWKTHP